MPDVKISSARSFSSGSGSGTYAVFFISENLSLEKGIHSLSSAEEFMYSSVFFSNSDERNIYSTSPIPRRVHISDEGSIRSSGTATFPHIVMPRYAAIQSTLAAPIMAICFPWILFLVSHEAIFLLSAVS